MKKKLLSKNKEKYNDDIYNSDYCYYQMEAEYMALHCQPCLFIKSLVLEFLGKLNGRNYSYTHRKIKMEITFSASKGHNYVYIRYDQYGYIRISESFYFLGFEYKFKADSADQIMNKIESFLANMSALKTESLKMSNRKKLIENWQKHQKRDVDGFLVNRSGQPAVDHSTINLQSLRENFNESIRQKRFNY